MSAKETTAKQTGPGVNPGAGSKSPSQTKAPASGASSLKPVIQPDSKAIKG